MLIIFSILYLLLSGLVVAKGTYNKAGIDEVPLIYRSVFIQFLLNISLFLWFVLSLILLFLNWKLFIILFICFILFGKLILYRLSQFLIVYPLAWLISKKME